MGQCEEVVCKGGAADVVGQMRLSSFSLGTGVDVAASSYMQPSQEGFHIEKEKKWGEGVSLDRASLYWYLTCADPEGSLTWVVAFSLRLLTASMASVGKRGHTLSRACDRGQWY